MKRRICALIGGLLIHCYLLAPLDIGAHGRYAGAKFSFMTWEKGLGNDHRVCAGTTGFKHQDK